MAEQKVRKIRLPICPQGADFSYMKKRPAEIWMPYWYKVLPELPIRTMLPQGPTAYALYNHIRMKHPIAKINWRFRVPMIALGVTVMYMATRSYPGEGARGHAPTCEVARFPYIPNWYFKALDDYMEKPHKAHLESLKNSKS